MTTNVALALHLSVSVCVCLSVWSSCLSVCLSCGGLSDDRLTDSSLVSSCLVLSCLMVALSYLVSSSLVLSCFSCLLILSCLLTILAWLESDLALVRVGPSPLSSQTRRSDVCGMRSRVPHRWYRWILTFPVRRAGEKSNQDKTRPDKTRQKQTRQCTSPSPSTSPSP